ncbi:helix-turn-helix transcriptional regulator [Paenibacillus athensensis]|uniref:AraC family transcriptional regulator n=1 Tax=Paenibacillus athensensis TaxID=1967502 RepID=A0A4Y8Q9J5_9BACL|nr:AraC family transcriptional regulator [Paenibacillus athensensis]MCD1260347.1 helix-turn-helix transcriptional regulator [Paenibacillus athensensis]
MPTIDFRVLPPPERLARDVECIRIAVYAGNQPLEVKVCPSGYPGIVFQLAEGCRAAIDRIAIRAAEASEIPVLFLHGQGAEPSVMHFRGVPYMTIQLVLKPHALYSVFGWDASACRQNLLPPQQFDAVELERQLVHTPSLDERVSLLNQFLINHLHATQRRDELIESALDHIHAHIASVTVQELIDVFHLSERQFQKRFARAVGMQPQLFIRVRRVNEALRLMHEGQYERLSDIAYALNYYDQSHFIRDMKLFSWVSPKHIAMKVSEFHNDLAGSSYL